MAMNQGPLLDLDEFAKFVRSQQAYHDEFLKALIAEDTSVVGHGWEGGRELAGQLLVQEKLRMMGCEVDVFEPDNERLALYADAEGNIGHNYSNRPNVVGRLSGSDSGHRSIILNGHIDTMPLGSLDSWDYDPLGGQIENGCIYGRGSCDMKGGLAAAIMALDSLIAFGCSLPGDVIIQSVVDEEGGGNGTLACCDRGYRADVAIITEPTSLEIRPIGMGFLILRVEVSGVPLHASQKWRGVNAIEKAIKLMRALQDLEHKWLMTKRHPLLPPPTILVGRIIGGKEASTVPAACSFDISVHYLPGDADEQGLGGQVEKEIVEALHLCAQGDDWLRNNPPTIRKYQAGAGYDTDLSHPGVVALETAYNRVTGSKPVINGCAYGCDARLLARVAETPTIVFGPGDPHVSHSINEYLPLDQYHRCIEILALTIHDWTHQLALNSEA